MKKVCSDEHAAKVLAEVERTSVSAAAKHFKIGRETIRRYVRHAQRQAKDKPDVMKPDAMLKKIASRYSPKELRLLALGGLPMEYKHTPVHNFRGERFKIGYMSDLHIGSVYTDYDYITEARREFKRAKVDAVTIGGDVCEGMSNRAGHIYECSELGHDAQKGKAIELLTPFDFCPVYMIDGNHDRWFMKSNGAVIVKGICDAIPNAKFLGHDEGDIVVSGARVKLWHGEDSSSYAISYRLQKLIESLAGGEKPHLILCGHVHKYGKFFIRNVHCISTACIQKQSKWMRSKRMDAHTGFGIVELIINDEGIGRITDTFFPFYV